MIAVARGDRVEKGTLLFRLDTTSEVAAEKQTAAQLAEARTTLDDTQRELKRTEALYARGNIAQAILDTSRAQRDRAGARMLAAAAAHDQAKWRLARREGHAPIAAIVQDVLFREGEFATASQPIVSLLPPENIKVRFFVPEAELGRIRVCDKVDLACSNCPTALSGTIRFVSTKAEFTPPVIYSEQSKEKLVYMIEAVPDTDPEALHPGQPVTVRLATGIVEGS